MYKDPNAPKLDEDGVPIAPPPPKAEKSKIDITSSFVEAVDDSEVVYDDNDDEATRAFKRMMAGVTTTAVEEGTK